MYVCMYVYIAFRLLSVVAYRPRVQPSQQQLKDTDCPAPPTDCNNWIIIIIINQIEDVVMGASVRKSSKSRPGLGLENPPHHLCFQTINLVEITIQVIHKYPEVNVYNLFAKSQPKGLNEYLVCKFTQSIHISGGI